MPQVQLNTRIDISTHTDLHAYAKSTGKPIARIVEEALINYLKEASPMKKVYSEYFDNEYTLADLDKEHSTVEHEGKTLYLLGQARICESNDEWYADKYQADAIDADGNAYRVYWQTTKEWDEACEYTNMETYIAQCKRQHEEVSQEDMDRFAELDAKTLPDVNDESNACNWDNPHSIVELKF